MILNMNQLRVFYTLVKTGSTTKAAQALMVTPPAVTLQVKQFEKMVGTALIFREGHTIYLTDAGKKLYEKSEKIFSEIIEMESIIEDMTVGKTGELRLGASQTHAKYVLPKIISAFEEVYPGIKVVLNSGMTRQMIKSIFDHTNELAFIACLVDDMRLKMKILGREELVLIAAKGSRYFNCQGISIEEVAKAPLVLMQEGSGLRNIILSYLSKFQIVPSILTIESSYIDFIKGIVRQDKGVSFFERYSVKEELDENIFQEIHILEGPPNFDIGVAYLRRRNLSTAALTFLRHIDNCLDLLPFPHTMT